MESELTPDIRNETKNEIKHQYLSAEKARALLDWRPLYSLDQALGETIAWYRDYFSKRVEFSDRALDTHLERAAA